jgi:hypothetical protein
MAPKTTTQRSIEALTGQKLVATVSDKALYGPLGFMKMRRQLGRSERLEAPAGGLGTRSNNQLVTLVDCGVNNLEDDSGQSIGVGDALAQQSVITCTVDFDEKDPSIRACNVIGRLSWGGDGHAFELDFDWRHGTVIRPVGGTFRVSARLALDSEGNQPTTGCTVGAWVGYGSPQALWGCTLTQRVAGGAPGLEIPPLATYLSLLSADPIVATWYAGGVALGSVDVVAGAQLAVPGGGATRVQFSGDTGPALAVWSLAL